MRKLKILLVAATLVIPATVAITPAAQACNGEICDGINEICNRAPKIPDDCVG